MLKVSSIAIPSKVAKAITNFHQKDGKYSTVYLFPSWNGKTSRPSDEEESQRTLTEMPTSNLTHPTSTLTSYAHLYIYNFPGINY